jgi:outer membrane protein assembly factor BamB
VDERQVAIRGNRLFAVVRGTAVQCRDATTGKVLWSNEQPEVVEALEWKQDTGALFQTQRALTVEGGIVFYGASYTRNFVSLDADTGELLSIVPMKEGGRGIKGVLENGRWIGQRQVFDTRTGKEIDSTHMTSGSCGPSLATPLMFCGGFGNVLLRASEQIVREKDVKSPCDIGMIVCDGIALSAASSCVCNLEMRGYRAFTHRATVRPQQRTSRERLQVLSDAPAARPPADELDWPAHRHDTGRGAATPARIGRGLAPQWRWSPPRAVDYVPSEHGGGRRAHVSTEPDVRGSGVIAAGDAVYFGDAYGVLRCVDATDGTERWAFPTAGPIPHAPAYWQGRVYLGDSDGTIHCLNARTGEPVWKFDAAPAQRRVFWYSKLVNTWPILGGVTLHGGRLYAVAGYQQDNGIHVWCLDAATGREVWSRHDVAQGTEEHGLAAAPGAYGTTCVAGGRLYLASGTLAPASFDLETGDWKCLPRLGRDHVTRRGAGVGALAAGWVMTFDRRLSFVHDVWAKRDKGLGCTLTRTDFDGKGWAAVGLPGLFNLPPAWDDDMIVMVEGGQVGPLVALAREDLVNAVHKDVQAEPGRRDYPVPTRILGEASFKAKELGLPRRWGPLELECVSVVLAEDAVVVTHALGGWRSKRRRRFSLEGWALSIVDRQSGAVRQRIELPEQPVVDQLCVDRAGRVLVGLRDGSVAAYGR